MRYATRFTKPTEVYVAYPRQGHIISYDSVLVIVKQRKVVK
jgi:hypothetical protein